METTIWGLGFRDITLREMEAPDRFTWVCRGM